MKLSLFSALFFLVAFTAIPQTNQWESYSPNKFMFDCIVEGNYLYAININGLFKYDLTTNTYEDYTRANSSIPFNSVSSLAKDKSGNIYFCTPKSLVKYDGKNFSEYPFTLKDYIYGSAIGVDSLDNVWIASHWGLIKFDSSGYQILVPDSLGYYGSDFNSLAISPDGCIWVSTGQYIAKYDRLKWTVYWETTQSSFYTLCLYVDKKNVLWAGGLGKYYVYDGSNWTYYNKYNSGLIQEDVEVITADSSGNMWFGTRQGISVYNGITWTSYNSYNSPLPNLWINAIRPGEDGEVFITTENGIVKYFNGQWENYSFSSYRVPFDEVHGVAVEAGGKLWVASGLNYGQQAGFKIYPDSMQFFENNQFHTVNFGSGYWWITDILIDGQNNKWIATSGGLFEIRKDTLINYLSFTSPLPSSYVLSLAEDHHNNIWVGTTNGLAKFDGRGWKIYNTTNSGLPANDISEVKVDKNQNVWVATGKGLAKFNGVTWKVYSTNNSEIGENYVFHFVIDHNGGIWLNNSYGLHHFNGTKWETFNNSNSLLPSNFLNDIEVDNNNNIWIGVFFGGVVEIDSAGNWKLYNKNNSSLIDNNINCIFIDANNNKIIGTSRGLNIFNENGIDKDYHPNIASKEELIDFYLSQNYPNPFNPITIINFSVPKQSNVTLLIYDALGREVTTLINEEKEAGNYTAEFNASNLSSGIYFYQIRAGEFIQTKKMVLLR